MVRILTLMVLASCLGTANICWAETSYTEAYLDDQGRLILKTFDGHSVTPEMDKNRGEDMDTQTGFDSPQISPDRKIVGWLSLYPNCCTSYDIPRELVLYGESRVLLRLQGNEQSIFRWKFSTDSERVAFCQGPLHFSDYRHYELRRISDGKLIAETNTGEGLPTKPAELWAAELDCP
jgi:hypothetical protein